MIDPSKINVLVACEESQAITMAFRERGFRSFSADLKLIRSTKRPDYHIPGDVTPLLKGCTNFMTQVGDMHYLRKWHLIIAHPPCTYLCKVSSVHMKHDGKIDPQRYEMMQKAREFFMTCYNAAAPYVAVENPLPMALANLPKPSCFIQPYWYGERYSKKTLFWLRNLPPLMPDCENPDYKEFVHSSRGLYRSRTFDGVAKAIAWQWGNYILDELNPKKI